VGVRLQSAWQLGREAALLGDDLRDDWEPKSDALLCARHSGDGLFPVVSSTSSMWPGPTGIFFPPATSSSPVPLSVITLLAALTMSDFTPQGDWFCVPCAHLCPKRSPKA